MDDAQKAFEKSIELDPGSHRSYANLANVVLHKGEYERALQLYDEALSIDPQLLPALYNRACIFGLRGDYNRMLEELDRGVLALREDHYMALMSRWEALIKLGRDDEASETLEKALRVNPEYVTIYISCRLSGTELRWKSGMIHRQGGKQADTSTTSG